MGTTRRRASRSLDSLGRFFVICFFLALVVISLGVFLIHNLFDEAKELTPPAMLSELAQIGQRTELKPPAASDQLRVYYTVDGMHLTPVLAPVIAGSRMSRGRQALETLFKTDPEGDLQPPVPLGVEVDGFYLKPDESGRPREVVVDLSKEILDQPLGGVGAELLCVYAIVNTALANTDGAEAVRILVDGRSAPNNTLWGHVDLSGALTPGALLDPRR